MADTPTQGLGLRKMTRGTDINTWGDPNLNNNATIIDQALTQSVTIPLTGGTTTLTNVTYATGNQAQYAALVFTGTGANTVLAPSVPNWYFVDNQTSGTINFGAAGGTTQVAIAPGVVAVVLSEDGIAYKSFAPTYFANQKLTGVLPGTALTDVATLANSISDFQPAKDDINLNGNQINNVAGPFAVSGAITGTSLTVSGNVALSGYVQGVVAGVNGTDAVNLTQVNALIGNAVTPSGNPATVRVNAADTTPGYIIYKIAPSVGTVAVQNPGGNETMTISVWEPVNPIYQQQSMIAATYAACRVL
jgi:hypothetical protein